MIYRAGYTKGNVRIILIMFFFIQFILFSYDGFVQNQNTSADKSLSDTSIYNSAQYFGQLYLSAKKQYAFAGKTKTDFSKWHKAFLPQLKQALGLDKMGVQYANYKLRFEKKATVDSGSFIFEKWIVWTEPTVPLPVSVLIPKNKAGKTPLIIATHGHGKNADLYDGIYPNVFGRNPLTKEMSIAMEAVNEGYIAIAPTMRAFGDTRTEDDKKNDNSFSCHMQLMRDLLTGRTPIGDRVWDMERILDWAIQNFSVDEKRIAITGNSGGGTVSLFAAACDSRITVAVPSSYFCTFQGSIGSIPHCDCNYIPGILDLGEMGDVAGLIAPRPLCVLHGIKDKIFPIAETRKAFAHLNEIYNAANKTENLMLYEGPEGHQYYKEGAWPFIKRNFAMVK